MSGLVVVGVDGSASSLAAAETAAREARWHRARLRVVHALAPPSAVRAAVTGRRVPDRGWGRPHDAGRWPGGRRRGGPPRWDGAGRR
ncbi:universal stress protein [Streptomyces javensis]|uniref:universal stress protein n=1 Tax=Streptomyces javensis TaxID=114698 RepID=UPI0033FD61B5